MMHTRRTGTTPELALRSAIYRLGKRYRVDYRLPGTIRRADLAFPAMRLAVFVDGCFWHALPSALPRSPNPPRILVCQDQPPTWHVTVAPTPTCVSIGWTALRFWEHDPVQAAASELDRVLASLSLFDSTANRV